MNLKKSIVIVNEFSIPKGNGKGTKGGTPGFYALRYMARDGATETLAPIRRESVDSYAIRYMAREGAVDKAITRKEMKSTMARAQGLGGVSFGYGELSLSDRQLRRAARDLQEHFDKGHTVLKTVISFDDKYLKDKGIVDPDFECIDRGDYRGNIDQMKLRMAIMNGLNRMSRTSRFDDLRYVGVIQVDTRQVHCHLAMVDAGKGLRARDGSQKGKLDKKSFRLLRSGIDSYLDEKQVVRRLSSAVGYEKRNVTSYVKRWAQEKMSKEAMPQFLIATLPENRSLWRAGTNRKEMRKPNRILREMVEERLAMPDSPLPHAMVSVYDYAKDRMQRHGLTPREHDELIKQGRERIVEGCMNGVYSMLRNLPEDALELRTPLLDVMSMDYEQLQSEVSEDSTELVQFSYRLRSYATRLNHHREKRRECHEEKRTWETLKRNDLVDPASKAVYDFYVFEEEYQAMLAAKYQHFLMFAQEKDEWYKRWNDLAEYGERIVNLEMMKDDPSLKAMNNEEEAEERGREIYGQSGGRYVTHGKSGRSIIEGRIQRMRERHEDMRDQLAVDLAENGMRFRFDDMGIEEGPEFDFETVKGLDLHHMSYDFSSDREIGMRAYKNFSEARRERFEKLRDAVDYLESTGQAERAEVLPLRDVIEMDKFYRKLDPSSPVLLSELAKKAREEKIRRSRTIALSTEVSTSLNKSVEASVQEAVAAFETSDTPEGLGA